MTPGRRGPAIPLLTLIASFAIVLVLGAWLGTNEAPATKPPTSSGPVPKVAPVRIFVADLTPGADLRPFPGVRITMDAADDGGTSTGSAGPGPAGGVTVCVRGLAEDWTVTGWESIDDARGKTFCRTVTPGAVTEPIEIPLEQRR